MRQDETFENVLPDKVEDGLHREDELGSRVWRHQVRSNLETGAKNLHL